MVGIDGDEALKQRKSSSRSSQGSEGAGGSDQQPHHQQQLTDNNNNAATTRGTKTRSLSETLAQSTAACLFHTGEKQTDGNNNQPSSVLQNQPRQEEGLSAPTRMLTDTVENKPQLAKLKVSASTLSLPLTSPLHTPREDESSIMMKNDGDNNISAGNVSGNNVSGSAAVGLLLTGNDNDVDEKEECNDNNIHDAKSDGRKRRMSIEEDILLGGGGDSTNSLPAIATTASSGTARGGGGDDSSSMPDAKRIKTEQPQEEEEKKEEEPTSCFEKYHKPAPWSARQNLARRGDTNHQYSNNLTSSSSPSSRLLPSPSSSPTSPSNNKAIKPTTTASTYDTSSHPRWRTHQIAEDYISLASSITLPPTHLSSFGYTPTTGHYPIEQVTSLGYLTSPLRRPTVIEKWSPYEISMFEAALSLHGKVFHTVQKIVQTKSTKEIIEFYYIWKKTSHGKRWKNSYVDEMDSDSSCSSSDGGEGESDDGDGRGDEGEKKEKDDGKEG